jgi:hypothetical protein
MVQKSEFRTVEFFRKVRNEKAAMLVGKSHEEIMIFFSLSNEGPQPSETPQRTLANTRAADFSR